MTSKGWCKVLYYLFVFLTYFLDLLTGILLNSYAIYKTKSVIFRSSYARFKNRQQRHGQQWDVHPQEKWSRWQLLTSEHQQRGLVQRHVLHQLQPHQHPCPTHWPRLIHEDQQWLHLAQTHQCRPLLF